MSYLIFLVMMISLWFFSYYHFFTNPQTQGWLLWDSSSSSHNWNFSPSYLEKWYKYDNFNMWLYSSFIEGNQFLWCGRKLSRSARAEIPSRGVSFWVSGWVMCNFSSIITWSNFWHFLFVNWASVVQWQSVWLGWEDPCFKTPLGQRDAPSGQEINLHWLVAQLAGNAHWAEPSPLLYAPQFTQLWKRVPGAFTRGGNYSTGNSRLYRPSVSQAQKVKESRDERPRLCAPQCMPLTFLFSLLSINSYFT